MTQRFVLLPPEDEFNRGENLNGRILMARLKLREGGAAFGGMAMLGAVPPSTDSFATSAASSALPVEDLITAETSGPTLPPVQVVKRLPDADGAMLLKVESDEDRLSLQAAYPGARIVPEGVASMALLSLRIQELASMVGATVGSANQLTVRLRNSRKKALPRTEVQCILDDKTSPPTGITVTTDKDGIARFLVPHRFRKVWVAAHPIHSAWPASTDVFELTGTKSITLSCPTIDATNDCVDALYGSVVESDGNGVTVAVIDGGVGPHQLITVAEGANVVESESPDDYEDNGIGHGTHVAGLIAGRRKAKLRGGLAPAVRLLAYRVFAKNEVNTGSFTVAEAIRRAVDARADLINLSLVLPANQPEVTRELRRARALGVAVIAAAGNSANAVHFPANFADVLGVSAMGILGVSPARSSIDSLLLTMPEGKDPSHRIAKFSCFGPEVDLVAPGAGVVSMYPRNRRSVMSGTSMAAPVVTARIAKALANNSEILTAKRDQSRSNAITKLALSGAKRRGFGAKFEGHGTAL